MKTHLTSHPIRHLHISDPVCIREDATIEDAIRLMQTQRAGCVLVCRHEELVGIITEVDVLRKTGPEKLPLTSLVPAAMTPSPKTVTRDTTIWDAAKRMKAGGFRHLPVVDESSKPEGYISIRSVVTYLADQFPETIYTQPPEPQKVPPTPEGA